MEHWMESLNNAARDGNRVVLAGKKPTTLWAGLGNRSGLHSFAYALLSEKWDKSGERFLKKLSGLRSGARVEVYSFRNIDRDRGRWVKAFVIKVTKD
jgi:nuclear transport factor 2 (NTF2) superfamily protein